VTILPQRALALALGPHRGSGPIRVLPALAGESGAAFTSQIVGRIGAERVLVLPAPDEGLAARRWHRDVWTCLSLEERRSLRVAAGPTALHFAAIAKREIEPLIVVDDPVSLLALQRTLDPRHVGRAVTALRAGRPGPASNPQSRALLAPWHDIEDLPLDAAHPDADRWRERLGAIVDRAQLVAGDDPDAPAIVGGLFGLQLRPVRVPSEPVERCFKAFSNAEIRAFSWLDSELRASAAGTCRAPP